MNEIIHISGQEEIVEQDHILNDNNELASVLEKNLSNVNNHPFASSLTMPIAEIATLGSGVASLLPAFRTITQTTTVSGEGLYKLANQAAGDALKVAKNGNYWGAYKTAAGTSKFVQLQEAGTLTATTETVAAINPATIMIAVALFSIEQKLGEISDLEKQILSFLEIEKKAEIEADVQMLGKLMQTYKDNWNNEYFLHSNHKLVLDIQRTARKNLNVYQKQISDSLQEKTGLIAKKQVEERADNIVNKFQYYKMSLVSFSMASMLEVMLSGNFKEEYINTIESEIEGCSFQYRSLYTEASEYIEKLFESAIDANVAKSVGTVSRAVGKFIESIPVISRGQVDEFLQDKGEQIQKTVSSAQTSIIKAFASAKDPETAVFTEKLRDMNKIFNKTEDIYFDDKNIYLIAG